MIISDIKKLNTHNLDEKLDATAGNLIDMLEESNERLTVKLAKQTAILEKLREMRK